MLFKDALPCDCHPSRLLCLPESSFCLKCPPPAMFTGHSHSRPPPVSPGIQNLEHQDQAIPGSLCPDNKSCSVASAFAFVCVEISAASSVFFLSFSSILKALVRYANKGGSYLSTKAFLKMAFMSLTSLAGRSKGKGTGGTGAEEGIRQEGALMRAGGAS